MNRETDLKDILRRIDHRGYPAYKDTAGRYAFKSYILSIDHVQGDPFASPSKLHVEVTGKDAAFAKELYDTPSRRVALEDHILRSFGREVKKHSFEAKGSGKSGLMSVSAPGQEVLLRSAVRIDDDGNLTVRFRVGFPARGRSILSPELIKILFDILPACVEKTLFASSYKKEELTDIICLADDRAALRDALKEHDLVAFVADGSVLPRESGVSDRPMKDAVPFVSPDEMAVTLSLPHRGDVRGMGIGKGVTLIVGGGYHGKSTLLKALERGVYDHIAGDGRELVITDASAVKLRAEDGRCIKNTDISMFIRNLPNGKDTVRFTTEDASGSTSQAANTVEAIEAGARVFLIDEDTSATNFMIRDELMQRVVHRDEEPIIPFIDRVEQLRDISGISTILVAGSSGAYFGKADRVIRMKEYLPYDITAEAKKEASAYKNADAGAADAYEETWKKTRRVVRADSRILKSDRIKTKTLGTDGFIINKETVDLRYLEQIVHSEQIDALSQILTFLITKEIDGKRALGDLVEGLCARMERDGFSAFSAQSSDHLAMPRKQEIYAGLNRCRACIRIE